MKKIPEKQIELVAIGCSAGGIEALKKILGSLRKTFLPAIVIVQHVSADAKQSLAEFFQKMSHLRIVEAEDQISVQNNTVYFAPAGYHLMISEKKTFELSVEEPVRFSRPSINVLFETAADAFGNHLLGILLTGANDDGADGLRKIHLSGGSTIVQDPNEAEFSEMPKAAIRLQKPDLVLSIDEVIRLLNDFESKDLV